MDHTSLPQQDTSFTEWLSTNFPEADAPLNDLDFTSLENVDFSWPEQPSMPLVTGDNTTLLLQSISDRLSRLEAAVTRVDESTQQINEGIRGVSSQVHCVEDLIDALRQGLTNFTKTLAELLRPIWANLMGDADEPDVESYLV